MSYPGLPADVGNDPFSLANQQRRERKVRLQKIAASLCPHCREDRRRRARELETPATEPIRLCEGSATAKRLWDEARDRLEHAGVVLGGSATEKLACRTIDELRTEELYELAQTPRDRRRANAEHWGRKLRVPGRQAYTSHPARAGP